MAKNFKYKSRAVGMQMTGFPRLDRWLRGLKKRSTHSSIAKPALKAGVALYARELRKIVPKKEHKRIPKSVGSRVDKGGLQNGVQYRALFGINVGKGRNHSRGFGQGAYPTFVVVGTVERQGRGQITPPMNYTQVTMKRHRAAARQAVYRKAVERFRVLKAKGKLI